MDEETELMLERSAHLQLLDLEARRAELTPDDPSLSDLEITYDLIEADIRATLQSIRDQRIARAIDNGGRTVDLAFINNTAESELRAQEERGRLMGLSPRPASSSSDDDDDSSNPLSTTASEPSDPESPATSVSDLPDSSQTATGKVETPPILVLPTGRDTVQCIICSDTATEAYEAPCGCFYDRNCVTDLFNKATTDESLFPPKCCNNLTIPFELIRTILSPELIEKFTKRTEELGTKNRLYCSNAICSNFLGPATLTEQDKTSVIKLRASPMEPCSKSSHLVLQVDGWLVPLVIIWSRGMEGATTWSFIFLPPTMDQDEYEALLEMTAQCQLMDLEELRAGTKGKARVGGPLSDLELTYNAIEAEARATLQYIQDRRIARGAEGASQEDINLIDTIAAIERQEQADRQYALALSANPDAPPPPPLTSTAPARSGFGFGSAYRDNREESPASSSGGSNWPWSTAESPVSSPASTSSRSSLYDSPRPQASTSKAFVPTILKLPPGRSSVDCVICGDYTNQAYRAPCGCFYDRQCLTELFNKATVDESLFPPRCCSQQISFAQVRSILSPQLVQKFETKSEEFKTPNRLYCHNSTCSRFLGPAASAEREKGARLCTQCWRSTCSFCKRASHAAHVPCETDTAAQQVLALGRQEGWQSCPSCHHMVELDTGCYHMTCRCRHEFCYLCARRWKECTCPQWDENRLIAQAERRVIRDLGVLPAVPRPAQVEARQQDIFRMAEDLRENHECDHHLSGFFKRNGSGNCESCGSWLRDFLLVRVPD
ncbi:unnamed protein product [Rhizoctonia solani]|uniref:RING-type domain-containing protein n=1 Tax=Rhizoctonia solani TaxID=456999 RepID=A0A8H3E4U6_9AGAM|nr:unnamed protein product [Rhizoctonia solani]